MDQRIESLTSQQTLLQNHESATPAQAEGRLRGETVRVEQNALSLVQDAAEELSFSASENVERKLSERKEGKDKSRSIEQIMFYVEQVDDINKEDLDQLLKQLSALKNMRGSALLQLTRQSFKDPTNQHAALSYAQANIDTLNLSESEKMGLRSALGEALRELESTSGRMINAGYNIAGVQAPELGLPSSSLRVLYRDMVIDFENYENTFKSMLEKFGSDEFPKAVNYLIKALGNDMTAMTPSSPKAALKEVLDGLYMVESLGTIYKETAKLLENIANHHGKHSITEREVIEPLLRFKDMTHIVSVQVSNEMRFLLSENPAQDAELTQGVRELTRRIPHKLYVSNESRQMLLNAMQELLDDAVDREEMAMEE